MTDTYRSREHRRLEAWLDEIGLAYESEVDILNYRVDVYLPEFHLAIEVDGPYHSPKRDRIRDDNIRNGTGIETVRLKGRIDDRNKRAVIKAIEQYAPSAPERRRGYATTDRERPVSAEPDRNSAARRNPTAGQPQVDARGNER